jgi:hypothetical protein
MNEPKHYHRDKEGFTNPQRTQIGAGQNASAPSSDEIPPAEATSPRA